MGRNSGQEGGKNKAKMNYLKQFRQGGGRRGGRGGGDGAQSNRGTVDAAGYKSGDYVSSYGHNSSYNKNKQRKPRENLTAGMKGFLLTTNFRESDCVREGYNLLNEYDEKRMENETSIPVSVDAVAAASPDKKINESLESSSAGEPKGLNTSDDKEVQDKTKTEAEQTPSTSFNNKDNEDDSDDIDIDEAIKKEMTELKYERAAKRFNSVNTGVKNMVFINTKMEDPNEIVYRIFDDVISNHEARARHILRFLPIEATCHLDFQIIRETCTEIFRKYFKDDYKSFKVVVNLRNNNKASKDEIIKVLAEIVNEINPLSFVDLKNPMYTVMVEVLKGIFCVTVMKDFVKYRKFNLAEAATPDKPPDADKPPETIEDDINEASTNLVANTEIDQSKKGESVAEQSKEDEK